MSFLEMPCYYNLTINIEAVTYHLNNTIGADSCKSPRRLYLSMYLSYFLAELRRPGLCFLSTMALRAGMYRRSHSTPAGE